MAVVMERLTEILIDRYRAAGDELEVDLSSVPQDVALQSDEVCCGYAGEALIHWPVTAQR